MSAHDLLKKIRDEEIQFVDLRFSDTLGKEQHLTLPVSVVDDELLTDGKMFDGSSIIGWKGINESDMVLMPDTDAWFLDPFSEHSTLNLRCDVLEPDTLQAYGRCPRSLAKRAEAYLAASGVADAAYFGPEPEFFVFDDVRWKNDISGASFQVDSEEAAWNSHREYDDGNTGHRPRVKGGYF
ncbi:MAG: glutamine synthetase, partial [Gammaproteobacteria bacterium HGW-Gammaproteobacteria-8]